MTSDEKTGDDEMARKARAKRLREEIRQLKKDEAADRTPSEATPPEGCPESPRDFIHRKMHELDEEKQG
jgi:hypothetical protein